MWKLLVNLALILHLSVNSAVINSKSEVGLECRSSGPITEYIQYLTCYLTGIDSQQAQVKVVETNLNMEDQLKLNKKIFIDVFGDEDSPVHFPTNLAKIINGTGGLTYENTPLRYISRETFKDMAPDLYLIKMEGNKIEEIPFDTFYDLPNLIYLDLKLNKLKSLAPNLFANAPNFRTLIIESNEIAELHPDLFKDCPEFEVLYAEFNKIEEFHKDLFKNNSNMTIISMRHNKIKHIPINFNRFKLLDVADFTHNGGTCDTMFFSFKPYDAYYDEEEQKKWIKTVPEFQQKIEEVCRQ